MTMKRLPTLATIAIVSWLHGGCQLPSTPPVDAAAVKNAELYFPPRFRYVAEPRFCFSPAERERALQEWQRRGANTLFEFVVDNRGKVRKSRVVKTNLWADRVEPMEEHARVMVFTADPKNEGFRAFYLAANYTLERTFEWLNQ